MSATLPAGFAKTAALRGVRFGSGEASRLVLELAGEVHLSSGQIRVLLGE